MKAESDSLITLHNTSTNYGQLVLQDADLLANGPMSNQGTLSVFGATSDLDIESNLGTVSGKSANCIKRMLRRWVSATSRCHR